MVWFPSPPTGGRGVEDNRGLTPPARLASHSLQRPSRRPRLAPAPAPAGPPCAERTQRAGPRSVARARSAAAGCARGLTAGARRTVAPLRPARALAGPAGRAASRSFAGVAPVGDTVGPGPL